MHCLTAWGQWAVQLLQYTAALPEGSGKCNSCNALPPCRRAVGSGTPAMHCLTAWGQWVVQLLQCTTSLSGGSGQWNSCNVLPHRLGAVGSGTPAMHCLTAWGQWAVDLLQCTASLSGAAGSAAPAMHCLTAWGQRAVQLLQCTASLPWGSGQWTSCNALPYCLGAVGSATPAIHGRIAWGQWAVQLLQCTASLPSGSRQQNSCNALPHCLGAVGSATPAMHYLTAWGQWAVQLLQRTAAPPWGGGHWNSCNALPHCLGAVGSGPPAMHCLTVWGSGQCNSCNTLPHCLGGGGQWTSCNALPRCLGAVGSATSPCAVPPRTAGGSLGCGAPMCFCPTFAPSCRRGTPSSLPCLLCSSALRPARARCGAIREAALPLCPLSLPRPPGPVLPPVCSPSLVLPCPPSQVPWSLALCLSVPVLPLPSRHTLRGAIREAPLPLPLHLAAPWCPGPVCTRLRPLALYSRPTSPSLPCPFPSLHFAEHYAGHLVGKSHACRRHAPGLSLPALPFPLSTLRKTLRRTLCRHVARMSQARTWPLSAASSGWLAPRCGRPPLPEPPQEPLPRAATPNAAGGAALVGPGCPPARVSLYPPRRLVAAGDPSQKSARH